MFRRTYVCISNVHAFNVYLDTIYWNIPPYRKLLCQQYLNMQFATLHLKHTTKQKDVIEKMEREKNKMRESEIEIDMDTLKTVKVRAD